MKILQFGKFYPIRGGVEKVMYDLMQGLSERTIHCDMLCASTENYPAGTYQLNAYTNLLVVSTKIKLAATTLAPGMLTRLRKIAHTYDLIHIHHPDPMACLALYCSGYKGKVILHWHSDILKQKALLKLYNPLQKWLIKRADRIVGTTPVYVEQSSFLRKAQNKVSYIPIGIPALQPKPEHVKAIAAAYPGKSLVFSLGRLVDYKGYPYLIKAAQYLPEDVHILIGGKGPNHKALQELINQLGVGDQVTLLGFIKDEEIAAYYEASDIFCLSSIQKTEAFAIVQIEAMSLGKPVVSTDIPGSGVSWVNQHEKSGLIAPVKNAKALASAIAKSLSPEHYDQLAQGSRQRFEASFTRDQMIDACLTQYAALLPAIKPS